MEDQLLLLLLLVNIVNLVRCLLENTLNKVYAKRGGRQFSMFISENICAMVDLFDKAVAEGAR